MSTEDPFAAADGDDDGGHTIIRPAPGGRRSGSSPPPPPVARSSGPPSDDATANLPPGAGLNPLETAAAPLLSLIMRTIDVPILPEVITLLLFLICGYYGGHIGITRRAELMDGYAKQARTVRDLARLLEI